MASFAKPGPFAAAMDASRPTRCVGENGSLEVTAFGVGESRTALFAALCRGCSRDRVVELSGAVVADGGGDAAVLSDLAVLAFQTRDCRGGKGEKALFYALFFELLALAPATAVALLPAVPEYGSWRDLCALWDACESPDAATAPRGAARAHAPRLKAALVETFAARLEADERASADRERPSLAAKYAPRERKKFAGFGKAIAARLFPDDDRRRASYRRLVAKMSVAVDVPEIKMCGKRWAEIDCAALPSRCLAKSRRAFLNEKVKRTAPLTKAEDATGDRFPDDGDRVGCRANLREAILSKAGVKGARLFPHEIVKRVLDAAHASTMDDDLANAQWRAIVDGLDASLADAEGGCLGSCTALVDVSGSMAGIPMQAAIALGLVVASRAAPAFRDRVLTFESTPKWHVLDGSATPVERIRSLQRAPWGGSTDFSSALLSILDVCVAAELDPSEIPDLVVFSDMQFDAADGDYATSHEKLVAAFARAGIEACGRPWAPPTVTYWNLRGDAASPGFAADAKLPGVRLLAGFSPALLKLLLTGAAVEEDAAPGAPAKPAKPTPYETLRAALDDARYDPIRRILSAADDGPFAPYAFLEPPPISDLNVDSDHDAVLVDAAPA